MARLGDICSINMGQSPDSSTYNEEHIGLPFFQGNTDFGTLHPSVRIWCRTPVKIAKQNDILISVRAPIGALNIADTECCIGRGLAALTVNPNLCTQKYLWYGLESKVDELNFKGTGSTFKAISKSTLFDTEIPLPSLTEQTHIAAVLDNISNLIALRKQQLDKLDELVKARFVEMFGDPVDNNHEWQTQPLDSVCKTIVDCPHSTPSYTDEDTGYMCIRTSIVKKNRILWNEIEYIPEHEYYQRIQRKRPEKGDVVYTREGAILGIAAMIDRKCNVALGQRSMLLSPDITKCLPQFLSAAMNFESFLRKALGGVIGSASPHINVREIKAFSMIVPPIELQQQFTAFIEQTGKSRLTIQQGLDKLEMIKKALTQKYFG